MRQGNFDRFRLYAILEIVLIIGFASIALFATFPYRVNIFLSWEGAYRLSQGQVPYRDFGMPLGYMFWVIPALFMKIFGTQMITLVKAQVFINIISGLAFRSILKSLGVQPGVRLLSVLLYCLSFSFFNFWPWYNHTVIVFEVLALAFLFRGLFRTRPKLQPLWLAGCALFVFCSFFTKQDAGGMAFLLCTALVILHCIYERKLAPAVIFLGSLAVISFLFIYPLTKYSFSYWFNLGQPPHNSRVDPFEIIDSFFAQSQWIKFYLLLIVFVVLASFRDRKTFFANKRTIFFLTLTIGILVQASVLQVTSYTPPDNNIYFHSFSVAFLLSNLSVLRFDFNRIKPLLVAASCIMLWWSGTYWTYVQRILHHSGSTAGNEAGSENVVNRKTYKIDSDTGEIPMSQWTYSKLHSLKKIYLPKPTIAGVDRLLSMALLKSGRQLRVLNMTELTTLAVEIPYTLERGLDQPLWYHYGVAMFEKEAQLFENRIRAKQYDLVLFENIPSLNNFYPFRLRDVLQQVYQKVDSFPAPRRGETYGTIEVYTKP